MLAWNLVVVGILEYLCLIPMVNKLRAISTIMGYIPGVDKALLKKQYVYLYSDASSFKHIYGLVVFIYSIYAAD